MPYGTDPRVDRRVDAALDILENSENGIVKQLYGGTKLKLTEIPVADAVQILQAMRNEARIISALTPLPKPVERVRPKVEIPAVPSGAGR